MNIPSVAGQAGPTPQSGTQARLATAHIGDSGAMYRSKKRYLKYLSMYRNYAANNNNNNKNTNKKNEQH